MVRVERRDPRHERPLDGEPFGPWAVAADPTDDERVVYRYDGPPLPTRAHETFLLLKHALAARGHDLGSVRERWTLADCAAALGVGITTTASGMSTESEQRSLLRRRIDAAARGETLPETEARITPAGALGVLRG